MIVQLFYDGSFEGLLTAVHDYYERKLTNVEILIQGNNSGSLFGEPYTIITDPKKANRVWTGIKKTANQKAANYIYKNYLSELPGIEDQILEYVKLLFKSSGRETQNFTNKVVMKMAKVTKMVDREKHRMDAFVRFRLTKDGIYVATIAPDFNVLPLNCKHFKDRYADQPWLIFDTRRNYGIYYNLKKTKIVYLEHGQALRNGLQGHLLDPIELEFTSLWQEYFKSTNIVERKNTELHLRHVPGRYWKYLSEKQG